MSKQKRPISIVTKKVKSTKRVRKNFFWTFILILFFWSITGIILIFIEPPLIRDLVIPNSYFLFFLSLFLAIFFSLSIVFVNTRRGFLAAAGMTLFLVLRTHGLGNILNLILIAGLCTAVDYFFTQKH